ncbi:serine/threonine-protein kinase 3-like isoform X2 [Montipora capricornis]|uniref:serine/threonine-protein kinase 3-like isoform X2 n=1 Tax=Montipora capricornis TaxID=246305 RepID=UPI0035F1F174
MGSTYTRIKAELDHMKTHKDCVQCERCKYLRSVIQQHANICCVPGCRVPQCSIIRNGNGENNIRKPQLSQTPREPVHAQLCFEPPFMPQQTFVSLPFKVIFQNSTLFPETGSYFQEHTDYHVNRSVKLGEGSCGQVYPVYCQSNMNSNVVVKETTYAISAEEVEIYKLLGDHHNIVKHYGGTFRGCNGFACIFMEKCEESLFNYMKRIPGGRLSVDDALFYWLQVLDGVDYLHNLGVIHKDIKAKNVLMKEGRALLADFDSAKRIPSEMTKPGLFPLGTRGFIAPEVLNRQAHGRPADVYSMGCFLVELTIGVPTLHTLQKKINELSQLDPELAEMVTACVSVNPEGRPSVRVLLEYPVVKRCSSRR